MDGATSILKLNVSLVLGYVGLKSFKEIMGWLPFFKLAWVSSRLSFL